MNAEETNRRLAEAESNVARALLRLQQVRQAIHQAEYEAHDARQAWAQARTSPPAPPVSPARADGAPVPDAPAAPDVPVPGGPSEVEPETAPFQPTERMRFVRWLVEQGRLSEWDVADR
jgi:hypothetical protein